MPKELSINTALALNLDADILSAAFPLLAAGKVGAIEWSFDALFRGEQLPDWFAELLRTYGARQKLLGHGVFLSLLSGRWTPAQQQWLAHLRELAGQFSFAHVTEHFGFFTGTDFHAGAPLPVPYSPATLRLGQDRLQRVAAACQCPVGLENLAFAYSPDEVKQHGAFLDQLLAPVDGFLILDLHNIYCQLHNFSVSGDELLTLYPLDRVREIHVSGGSWEDSVALPGQQIRRDTHDEAVPTAVFELLRHALPRCPNLKFVVLEQIGGALKTEPSRAQFRRDFLQMTRLVEAYCRRAAPHPDRLFRPTHLPPPGPVVEDEQLHEQQRQLARIMETAASVDEARRRLHTSALAATDWQVEQWAPHMLETAVRIAQKWQ